MKLILVVLFLFFVSLSGRGQGPTGFDAQGDALPAGAIARYGTLRFRHDAPITCQAITNDGKLIATGGGRTVRVWDAKTGRQLYSLSMIQNNRAVIPAAVAFSVDGRQLAALGMFGQGVLAVWDLRGGQSRQEFLVPQRDDGSSNLIETPFLAFTSSGKQLLLKNSTDKNIRLLDIATGTELRVFQDVATLNCVTSSADGTLLAAGTDNKQIILWKIDEGRELHRLQHVYPLVALSFSTDSQRMASIDLDLAPTIWNVSTGHKELTLPGRTRSAGLCWSSDGRSLHISRVPDQILTWNLASKSETLQQAPSGWVAGPLYAQESTSGGVRLMLGSTGRRGINQSHLRLLTLGDQRTPVFDGYSHQRYFPLYLSARKQWATISTKDDSFLRVWNENGQVAHTFHLDFKDVNLNCFAQSLTGTHLAFGGSDGRVHLVNTQTGKLERSVSAFHRNCNDVEFTQDGKQVIVTDLRTVCIIDLATGKKHHQYELHTSDTMRTTLSHDGSRIASMHYVPDDEQVVLRILEAATGKVLTSDTRLASTQQNFHLSHDGRSILVISSRGRNAGVTVIEAASGKPRFQADLPMPYLYVTSNVRMSPDGQWLALGASGNDAEQFAAVVWMMGTNKEPVCFVGHRGQVESCHFSNDGKQMLTVSNDTTMLAWDLLKHRPLVHTPWEKTQYQKHWQELGTDDAARAYTAIHRWAKQPNAVSWLGTQLLQTVSNVKPEQIAQWIRQLNATQFSERQQATELLTKHAATARLQLQQVLEQRPAPEVKRRLEQILEKARESSGLIDNPLLFVRAIEALELMGTSEALQQLQTLAERQDTLGREAREAANRLRYRLKP